MPSSPKSSTAPKKSGAPKAKGAVRAKSGCYTCRIRRKKCDERPDDLGRCETCVRLRLQCLGFGAKRPEWLRENNNVLDIREKIKTFLASQGMIKGHSGSGPRAAEQEPSTLRLANEGYSSASESPPSQLLVLNDDIRHVTESNVREEWSAPFNGYGPPVLHSSSQQRHESPYGSTHNEESSYDPSYLSTMPHNSTSLVPPWIASNSTQAYSVLPTAGSRFGASYTLDFADFNDQVTYVEHVEPGPRSLLPQDALDDLANHYMMTVYELQYQLADKDLLSKLLFDSVQMPGSAREAARLLASVHCQRSQSPTVPALDGPTKQRYDRLRELLSKKQFNEDDALAALNVISTFLFDGGHGEWQRWLEVASSYSLDILEKRNRHNNYRDALLHCNEKDRFIIKTVIWFDVLASVTTMQPPLLDHVITEIFNPEFEHSGIFDTTDMDMTLPSPELSMMDVMGCDNRVVWALAQISKLSQWKVTQQRKGMLSVPDLVKRASEIEAALAPRSPPPTANEESDIPRILTSEIFRTSAMVYLQTIVSGDYPLVPEIRHAVNKAVVSLHAVSIQPDRVKHVVVRSTVFAYFLCGCLTSDLRARDEVRSQLENEGNVGNCHGIRELLRKVCHSHRSLSEPVPWREALRDESMLVV